LPTEKFEVVDPYVLVSVVTPSSQKKKIKDKKTKSVSNNGFCPKWDSIRSDTKGIEFQVDLPEVSFLKFQVFDKDFVSRDDIIAYAYIPFNHIQTGSEYMMTYR
jgi:hypothetical protein